MAGSLGLATLNVDRLNRHVTELLGRNEWPRARLLAFQRERLRQALRHAVDASPYYRETIGDLVANGAPFESFPVLTKSLLMKHFDRIVTDRRLTRTAIEQHLDGREPGALMFGKYRAAATGGTTGERGVFVYDDDAWLSVIANIVRFQRILGISAATRGVGIAAASPIHLSYRFYEEMQAIRPGAPRLNLAMPVADIVESLNAYQPESLATYPSFIRVLAAEQAAGRLKIAPRLIRTGAESLTQQVRDLAHAAWQAPIVNSYSCTEVGFMGQECGEMSGIHLSEDLCVFEVVDEQNRAVPAGTSGAKLLVTTLTNHTLPIVRYELTDIVALAEDNCRCGLPFARIGSIEGRREEILQFPGKDGGSVAIHAGRLRSPLIGAEGIRQFQFAPMSGGLEILVSLFPECDPEAIRLKVRIAIQQALDILGAAPTAVDVRVVDEIERAGAGAKERLVARSK